MWVVHGPVRWGAGLMAAWCRMFHTLDAAMRWPSRQSSPWTRRYPQVGFSVARRRTGLRSSPAIGDRQSPTFTRWRLCPLAGDQASVPAEDRGGLHDPHHVGEAPPVEHGHEHSEDRAVGLGGLCTVDLTLQDVDLVPSGDQRESPGRGTARHDRTSAVPCQILQLMQIEQMM